MNEPKIPPLPEPHAANESGSTVCTVCWFIETDAGWIGSYNKEALDQLNRRDQQWQAALQAAVLAEREAIIDLVSFHGGSVEIEAAIRARSQS